MTETGGPASKVEDEDDESESEEDDDEEATRLFRFLVRFLGAGSFEDAGAILLEARIWDLGNGESEINGRLISAADLKSASARKSFFPPRQVDLYHLTYLCLLLWTRQSGY